MCLYKSYLTIPSVFPEGGSPVNCDCLVVVSEEFVASQVRALIERREQFLRENDLSLDTIMDNSQKDAFLASVKAEYHGSEDQLRRQEDDRRAGKSVPAGKKQRWSRECQRRGGTTQMFHLLSFSGQWDPSFFATDPVPQLVGEQAAQQKKKTLIGVQARADVRLARKYDRLKQQGWSLTRYQNWYVNKLNDGTLEKKARQLTLKSGHGRLQQTDGTFIDIGGSTGGFTRAVLYNWVPPTVESWQ